MCPYHRLLGNATVLTFNIVTLSGGMLLAQIDVPKFPFVAAAFSLNLGSVEWFLRYYKAFYV